METPSASPSPRRRRSLGLRAAEVGLCTLAVLLATAPGLPIVWDEGNAIFRAGLIGRWPWSWFQQAAPVRQPGPDGSEHPLSREAIEAGWPYTTQVEGHPACYGIVIAAGEAVARWFLPPLTAWRFGPMVLFALAAGVLFYRMSRLYGQGAGWVSVLALLLQPRLFAHAHFATCDGPLTACWLLAWAAFPEAHPSRTPPSAACDLGQPHGQSGQETARLARPHHPFRRLAFQAALFGLLLGMTMSCKATGWIAPIPFVLWAVLYRDRRALAAVAIGLPAALATFYLLNPPLWHEPIEGLLAFFRLNTNRQLNVANFFLGRMYDLHHSLPWYNTLVWTAIAVPIGLLPLALVGLGRILRRPLANRAGMLLVLNWMILLVVRALPGTPPHDGIRLFLPAFAFLAPLIAIGTVGVQASAGRLAAALVHFARTCAAVCLSRCPFSPAAAAGKGQGTTSSEPAPSRVCACRSSRVLVSAAMVLVFVGSATSLVCYAPQWLSYYNLAVGGLPGAARVGMEPTYYWDSLDAEVLQWLGVNTAEGEKVLFGSAPSESLALIQAWGTLPVEFRPGVPGRYRWYVIQRRPSACMPPDQWLLRNAQPVYKKYLPSYGPGPWHMNVPLLEIYRYEDYQAALQTVPAP